ncbi:MAG TPA: IS110 family transposase, partial [Armatimonadota bacterium]
MRKGSERQGISEEMVILHPHAAGLDIGSTEIWACIPADGKGERVRCFGTYTTDLEELADWLEEHGVTEVAMESTGVYWIPVYELLEDRGMNVMVVNARHIKNVPGRKSDVQDCQWIQRLHAYGLLSGSFRPQAEMCALRAYLRHRDGLIEHRAAHIQHMQKALLQMNIQLGQVLSDLTGQTGLAILRAIVAGEHNPMRLVEMRKGRCEHSRAEMIQALTGHYRPEHVFALKQALALFDAYTAQIRECDQEIERQFATLRPQPPDDLPPLPPDPKPTSHCKNAPDYDARSYLYGLAGVDFTAIPGLNASLVQRILAEVGLDMDRFPTVKDFCSWLGLAPHNAISGGRVLYSHTLHTHNRAGQAFRLAAQAVSRGKTIYSEFYRRVRARSGPKEAIVATAHKIARTFYFMLKRREPFRKLDVESYLKLQREKDIRRLSIKAAKLGL